MKKNVIFLISLIIILITIVCFFFFKNHIYSFWAIKKYEKKYEDLYFSKKDIIFDNINGIEKNEININDFYVSISDFKYIEDEKRLELQFKFKGENPLNRVDYVLRVYNLNYCLGDMFNGDLSLDNGVDYIINYNKFYEKNFGYKNSIISLSEAPYNQFDLLGECKFENKAELLDSGEIIHKISLNLPEKFIVEDKLNIDLFDINYQYIGNKELYKVAEPLCELNYIIDIK